MSHFIFRCGHFQTGGGRCGGRNGVVEWSGVATCLPIAREGGKGGWSPIRVRFGRVGGGLGGLGVVM